MSKRNITQRAGFNWARSNLITEAGVLAKRANQRIHEIVSKGSAVQGASNAYQYLRTMDYDKVPWLKTTQRKIKKTGETVTEIQFATNFRNLSDKEIQYRIKKIKEFLDAKTSKVKGVRERIAKQTKAFNEKTGQTYTESEFVDEIMSTDVKELFKQFDPSDIQSLFSENREYALNADAILQAIVDEKKQALAGMEWSDIVDAFPANLQKVLEEKEKKKEKTDNSEYVTEFELLLNS